VRKQRFCTKACSKGGERNAHWNDDVAYKAAHNRVERKRGKTRNHRCVDCASRRRIGVRRTAPAGLSRITTPRALRAAIAAYDGHVGETHMHSKLSDAQGRGIRASVLQPERSIPAVKQQELAEHFGVTQSVISDIRNGQQKI
jgi:hypothetical protein